MNVVFRADASLAIGSGHVMRCLTLADALAGRGHRCHFLCRDDEGHLGQVIGERGYGLTLLGGASDAYGPDEEPPPHGHWLTVHWAEDARVSAECLAGLGTDLLVVDHYALDHRWAEAVRGSVRRIAVIDDLADRRHDGDLLLDQNLGRRAADYGALVPEHCRLLMGPEFALIGPAFGAVREESLERRSGSPLHRIMVSMGGVDADDATGQVLDAIAGAPPPDLEAVSVIMGRHAPHLDRVRMRAAALPFDVEVAVGVSDMAHRMAEADLGIGGAGVTAWERCAVGLPSIAVVLAGNQRMGAQALGAAGAALVIDGTERIGAELPGQLARMDETSERLGVSAAAAALVDGRGLARVAEALEELTT